MSRINAGMYESEDQTWMSPPDFIAALLRFEGVEKFDLDPACSIPNIPAYRHIFYPERDGLIEHWGPHPLKNHTLTFINPPYGDFIKLFMKKICEEINNNCRVWALIPSRTETQYQHDFGLSQADFTVFLKGRLNFIQSEESKNIRIEKKAREIQDKKYQTWEESLLEAKAIIESNKSAPFPCMLLYFGNDWVDKADRWLEAPGWPGELMVPAQIHRDYVVQKRLDLFGGQKI